MERTYIAIDLKSFYASVECAERQLDPLTTNLVVADASRTEKTICLAVSPSLKAHGIPGRARLFEVVQKVKEVNQQRMVTAIGQKKVRKNEDGCYVFSSSSFNANALAADPSLELSYIVAPPRMRLYMDYSTRIYHIYLKYVSPDDIHVYSIDEVFIDVTHYLSLYRMSARELAMTMIRDILYTTGITATGGIGTNLYLAKVAMDIVAKHVPADKDGVRIAELDEWKYRELLWTHEPITDFWRIGRGYAKKLAQHGMTTMGDVARCSIGSDNDYYNEELLYKLFGVNAELLIDHAWGWEPTTIDLIKAYKPESSSISTGQVLSSPYPFEKAKIIVREMTDLLVLDLVDKGLVTDQIVLTIGYDRESLTRTNYSGPIISDGYGRQVPKYAHGSINLGKHSSSTSLIMEKVMELFQRIVNPNLLVRRVTIAACHIFREELVPAPQCEQLDLFTDFAAEEAQREAEAAKEAQEKKLQKAMLKIQKRFGKNAILKGTNFEEGATTRERNGQVGGHKG
ncbi:MAG: DNA methylase [Clostridiales bacterium]|nr:DNA methylase [Clostridiales bacterium]